MRLGLLDFEIKCFCFYLLDIHKSKAVFEVGFVRVAKTLYEEMWTMFRFRIGRDEAKFNRSNCQAEIFGHKFIIYEW
jgi:hypothetical protein